MRDINLEKESYGHPIIIFDGICHLCNHSVKWIIQRDKNAVFKYCTLQYAQEIGIIEHASETVVLYYEGKMKIKSAAALSVLKLLGGKFKWLYYVGSLIPLFISDAVYDFIAKNRYRWFGKYDTCMLPQSDWQERFIGK